MGALDEERWAIWWRAQTLCCLVGFWFSWQWAAWSRGRARRALEKRGTAATRFCRPDGEDDDDGVKNNPSGVEETDRPTGLRRRGRGGKDDDTKDAPKVSVVMPVKGAHPESASNWRTQLQSAYRGEIQYIFVLESEHDPGAPLVKKVLKETERNARIRYAGASMTCSQKIHNMLAGLEGSDEDSTYVLFLDDDVRLHRNTIGSLVSSMEANQPKMFLTNGFPFDLPPKHGVNFPSYMTMAFHMVLLIAFSHPGEWTKNVWGGCMMARRSSFVNDEHGCRSKYERGGYSDDLILAALCDEFRRTVGAPADCIFPQRVKHTWRQWWNYMRRQLFVMDTYSTTHNKRVNHGMLLVLSYLSLAVTSGVALCVHDLGVWAYEIATESGGGTPGWEVTEWTLPRTLSVCAFFAFAGAMGGARSMYVEIGRMATLLGDEGVTESVAAIDWWRVGAAFWCCYACVPAMAIYTLANPQVVWSGIPYRKRRGLCMRMPTDDQIRRMKIERMNAGFGFKVPEVDAGTLLLEYHQNPRNLVVVDVRTEKERAVSVIKGAVTKEQYEADVNDEYVGKKVVAYCTIGYRSGKYVEKLIKDKGVDAYNLRGSILAWTHAGGPLETADGTPTNVVHTWGKAWALPRSDHVAVYFDRPAVAFVKKVLGLAR